MTRVDGQQLRQAIMRAQEAFEGLRALAEEQVRSRIRGRRRWEHCEEDEIAEKVFEKVARALGSYDRERAVNPFSWLMTVVDHRIIDYCRTHKIPLDSLDAPAPLRGGDDEPEAVEPADDKAPSPPAVHRQLQSHQILIEVMARLGSDSRKVILLLVTLFPDLSYEEMIKITGHPSVAAAKESKYRVMKRMREALAEMGYGWEMFGDMFRPD
jgi:RNA polymerase sigma factor (sigma-70 family)